MNCHEFNAVVGELADGRLMEAGTREAGLKHAGVCVECATLLIDGRSVVAALRVASRAETEEAPARVKQSLLAAFAERQRASTAPANVVELSSRRPRRRWVAAAMAAAAAVVLIALALPTLLLVSPDESQVPAPDMSLESGMSAALPPTAPAQPYVETGKGTTASKGDEQKGVAKRAAAHAHPHAPATRGVAAGGNEEVAQNVSNEYLPLTYLNNATAIESGTVVRVRLSRSALISLGVPVSADREDEFLKAEVVLGDDGVARAIRLVR